MSASDPESPASPVSSHPSLFLQVVLQQRQDLYFSIVLDDGWKFSLFMCFRGGCWFCCYRNMLTAAEEASDFTTDFTTRESRAALL